ncbi:hypothetical protein BDZ97DRAFT_1752806 [Flammula alnicola]|nr:hypothetical protein BDZ97DRAFT_1752806 [Flammula alnicola]
MAYLNHVSASQQASTSTSPDAGEQEQRKKAVQKFLARAEIAMGGGQRDGSSERHGGAVHIHPVQRFDVTRALRARLAYASYKATHNIPHVPLRDLEAQSQSQTASFNRTIAAKRKAVGATNYYNNPATQGPSTSGAGSLRRGGSGNMAPPAAVSSPRTHTPSSSIAGTPGYSSCGEVASSLRNPPQVPSLYSSILAPPPTKQARTIHNPNDPPVPAPSRPAPSPRTRPAKVSPKNETSRSQGGKAKASSKPAKAAASPRKTKGGSVDKGKRKQHVEDVDVDGDVDMKAAATLTSLLMHHRPSIAGSTSSPRSSIDGSEVGSAYSYSHFAQSSARTAAPNPPGPVSAAPSSSSLAIEPAFRSQTPPPGGVNRQHTTPRAAPTDSEAANLMLFLATSPSPARPANKDSKDMTAYRALGGGTGPLRSKGRVLFPSTSATDSAPPGHEDASAATAGAAYKSPALTRGGDHSFTSSISSIGSDLGGAARGGVSDGHSSQTTSIPAGGSMSASSSGSLVSQLLPPAPLPLPSAPTSPTGRKDTPSNAKPTAVGVAGGTSNAGPLDFNFHEFINASPSPSRSGHGTGAGGPHKSNLGLRADVGRKLFEEEQMRQAHAHALQQAAAVAATAVGSPGRRQDERTLGAGIDLIHS